MSRAPATGRTILATVAALAMMLAVGGASAAATTVVDTSGDGSTLRIEAGAGDRNRVDVYTQDVDGGPAPEFVVRDMGNSAGGEQLEIVAGDASCGPGPTAITVHCETQGVSEVAATLGARRDTFGADMDGLSSLGVVGVMAHGGNNRDVLAIFVNPSPPSSAPALEYIGAAGDDSLVGSLGPDLLRGGTGSDDFLGYEGNDRIRAADGEADGVIDCGPGIDHLTFDAGLDPEPDGCE